jgi:hypothetical protein
VSAAGAGSREGNRSPDDGGVAFLVVTRAISRSARPGPGTATGWDELRPYTDAVDHEVERLRPSGDTVVTEPADRE